MLKYVIAVLFCIASVSAAPSYLAGHHGHGELLGGYHHAAPVLSYGHGYSHGYAAAPALIHAAPLAKIAHTTHYAAPAIAHHSYAAPIIRSYAPTHYAAPSIAHAAYPAHGSYHTGPLLGYGYNGLHGLHGIHGSAAVAHGW